MQTALDYSLIRNTITHLPLAVAIFDRALCFVACSRRFIDECDVSIDPVGRHFHEVFPGTGDRWLQLGQRGLAGESLSAQHDSFVWAGGAVSWLDWEMTPWMPDGVEIAGIVVTVKVLNEDEAALAERNHVERQAEQARTIEALQRSQERLMQAERIAAIGYWVSNFDGSDPHFSEGVYSIYGLPADSPFTSIQELWQFTHDNRYRGCVDAVRRAIECGEAFEVEYVICRPDGSLRTIHGRGAPLYDPTGQMIRLQGIIQDITAQVVAAKSLREREQQLAEAQHIAHIGSWRWDIVANEVTWSQELYVILGYDDTRVEPSLAKFMDRVLPEDRAVVAAKIDAALSSKHSDQYRHRILLPNGETRTLHVRHRSHVDESGMVVLLEGTSQDVTEMIAVEGMLAQQAKDLAQSNHDLTQFAYIASHDLREPLRKVKSFTELLALRYSDQLDEQGREWVRYIVNDTARMQTLIQDVLDYSQISQDRQLKQAINLNRIFEQTCTSLHTLIQSTGAQVMADELPVVLASPTQMSQLLQNLLENALKFRSAAPPRISIKATRNGDCWRVEVTDNGLGIEASQQQRIFEMFGRVHRRDQYEGNGLGLAVCKKIVEGHGGQIGVESEPGRGSTFWFTLPDGEVIGDW